MNEDAGPIFRQVAAEIENAIVDGSLAEEAQAPSSTWSVTIAVASGRFSRSPRARRRRASSAA